MFVREEMSKSRQRDSFEDPKHSKQWKQFHLFLLFGAPEETLAVSSRILLKSVWTYALSVGISGFSRAIVSSCNNFRR